jgi:hypothetical protein
MQRFKQRLWGNIGVGLVSGITALSMAGVAMQMGYSHFKLKAEKQLHILNSIRLATVVQIGLEEGWVNSPDQNGSITLNLSDIDESYPVSSTLKNPSNADQLYGTNSLVTIENNQGKLMFYCALTDHNSTHIYTDDTVKIYNLTLENITLNYEGDA